jgi:hypothetical protein
LSTHRLVTLITFLAIFAMAARISVDSDTWWHLRAGQWIVENRAVPQTDPFSYTRAGEAWKYPGWLVEVPMYWLYQTAGPGGLNLWTAVMVTLTFVFVWQTLSGGTFLKAFITVLAAAASGVYWAARPYLVTFLLAAVILWILEVYRWQHSPASQKRLWWLPVLMVVWVNSHGGFAVGFILFGVYWLDDLVSQVVHEKVGLRRLNYRLTLIGLLMLLAVCLNPSGSVMLAYPFKTVSIGALGEYIQEWQSPNFHLRQAQPFIWLLILTIGAVGISRRRLALSDFLLVSGFTYMALMAWRNVALFALVAPIALTRYAAPVLEALGRRWSFHGASTAWPRGALAVLNWAMFILLVLAALLQAAKTLPTAANEEVFRENMPVGAVEYICKAMPPGRLFNSYNWGGYLLWELPEYPVFIDGRTDLYNDEIINQWLQVVRGERGWREALDRWGVRLVLLEPAMPVVSLLPGQGWLLLYADETAVVYGR